MKAAFIGLGTMGESMARNIMKAGHELTVYNRTKAKADPLVGEGATWAGSPREAAQGAEIVVICVSDTPDVEAVVYGENGILEGVSKGTVVVDCSTISPVGATKVGESFAEKGIGFLDAPISGGSEGARLGTLAIMIGGEAADVEKAMPILEAMGKTITHVGPSGSGQLTKAINQIVIAGNYLAVAEGMALGLKAGLDMDKVVAAIKGGAAASWVLDNRSGNMIKNEYPLGFRLSLHRKDLGYVLETSRKLGLFLPMASLVASIEDGLISRGFGDDDNSAIARTIREQSGIDD